jgi:DNA (cytosine-5)-methyltransferase 1
MMLRHFDVCSGIGGFSLGFRWAALSEPVAFCEIDPYCQKVLAKNFPNIPIFNDVKELVNDRPESTRTIPDHDILTSGYPCQPFSVAGQRRGEEDERNIWRFVFEIVKRKHPTWCVFENVYGHIAMGLDQVLHDMESEGYSTQTFVVPACSLNAPHKRDRLWIVGNSEHDGSLASKIRRGNQETSRGTSQGQSQAEQSSGTSRRKDNGSLADTESEGLQGLDKHSPTISTKGDEITDIGTKSSGDKNVANSKCMGRESRTSVREELAREESHGKFNNRSTDGSAQERARSWWDVEPNVGRVAYGIPSRVDRLRGLGNAIVPQIAMQIGLSIKEAMNDDYTKKD